MKRLGMFAGLAALLVFGYVFLLSLLRGKLGSLEGVIPAGFLAMALLFLNVRCLRSEDRSLADLGITFDVVTLRRILAGLIGGTMLIAAWAGVVTLIGKAEWQGVQAAHPAAAGGRALFILLNNLGEELAYRGYAFLLILRMWGGWTAVTCSSLLFALLHVQSGVPWPNALVSVLPSGIIFALLFLRWRSLPLALSFHAATNLAQEALGLRESPLSLARPFFRQAMSGGRSLAILALIAIVNLIAIGLLAWLPADGAGSPSDGPVSPP